MHGDDWFWFFLGASVLLLLISIAGGHLVHVLRMEFIATRAHTEKLLASLLHEHAANRQAFLDGLAEVRSIVALTKDSDGSR